jgi:hypothetical protein
MSRIAPLLLIVALALVAVAYVGILNYNFQQGAAYVCGWVAGTLNEATKNWDGKVEYPEKCEPYRQNALAQGYHL